VAGACETTAGQCTIVSIGDINTNVLITRSAHGVTDPNAIVLALGDPANPFTPPGGPTYHGNLIGMAPSVYFPFAVLNGAFAVPPGTTFAQNVEGILSHEIYEAVVDPAGGTPQIAGNAAETAWGEVENACCNCVNVSPPLACTSQAQCNGLPPMPDGSGYSCDGLPGPAFCCARDPRCWAMIAGRDNSSTQHVFTSYISQKQAPSGGQCIWQRTTQLDKWYIVTATSTLEHDAVNTDTGASSTSNWGTPINTTLLGKPSAVSAAFGVSPPSAGTKEADIFVTGKGTHSPFTISIAHAYTLDGGATNAWTSNITSPCGTGYTMSAPEVARPMPGVMHLVAACFHDLAHPSLLPQLWLKVSTSGTPGSFGGWTPITPSQFTMGSAPTAVGQVGRGLPPNANPPFNLQVWPVTSNIFIRDTVGHLWWSVSGNPTSPAFPSWVDVDLAIGTPPAWKNAAPDASSWGPRRFDITSIDTSGNLWFYTQDPIFGATWNRYNLGKPPNLSSWGTTLVTSSAVGLVP
jgi:hypothetical protein